MFVVVSLVPICLMIIGIVRGKKLSVSEVTDRLKSDFQEQFEILATESPTIGEKPVAKIYAGFIMALHIAILIPFLIGLLCGSFLGSPDKSTQEIRDYASELCQKHADRSSDPGKQTSSSTGKASKLGDEIDGTIDVFDD